MLQTFVPSSSLCYRAVDALVMFCTFGVFPHDFRRRVTLHRAVENSSFAIDTVLVVGLHHKPWRHCGMEGGGKGGTEREECP